MAEELTQCTQVENEPRASLPSKQGAAPEQLSTVEEAILKLSGQLSTITRQQKYFRTRENRNFSTVRSTEKRIWNFSLIESAMMIAMAGLQVFIVKMFFTGGRKGKPFVGDSRYLRLADNLQDTCDPRHILHSYANTTLCCDSTIYRPSRVHSVLRPRISTTVVLEALQCSWRGRSTKPVNGIAGSMCTKPVASS